MKDAATKAMEKLKGEDKMSKPASQSMLEEALTQAASGGVEVQSAAEVAEGEAKENVSLVVIPDYGTPEKALGDYVSTLGLTLPDGLNWPDYQLLGSGIRTFKESGMWIVGDFLNYGIDNFGEDIASQIVDSLGYEEASLAAAKSVSKAIPMAERRQSLSWRHHQTVAKMESGELKRWLDQAEESHWNSEEFRDRIRAAAGKEKAQRGRPRGIGKSEKVAKARAEAMTVIQMAAFAENQFAPNLLKALEHMADFVQLTSPILKSLQSGAGIAVEDAKSMLEPIDDLTKKLARLREQSAQIAAFQPPEAEPAPKAKKAKAPKEAAAKPKAPRKARANKKTKGNTDVAAETSQEAPAA